MRKTSTAQVAGTNTTMKPDRKIPSIVTDCKESSTHSFTAVMLTDGRQVVLCSVCGQVATIVEPMQFQGFQTPQYVPNVINTPFFTTTVNTNPNDFSAPIPINRDYLYTNKQLSVLINGVDTSIPLYSSGGEDTIDTAIRMTQTY